MGAVTSASSRPRIAIGIASTGRPGILAQTLPLLDEQTETAERVLLAIASPSDMPAELPDLACPVEELPGPKGLTRQRNRILDAAGDVDAVVFLDDDYLMAPDFLARVRELLSARPDMAVATGRVIADGIGDRGLALHEGLALITGDRPPTSLAPPAPTYNAYGCNMVVATSPLRRVPLRFDEALPLYGWLEDVDFSRRMSAHGAVLYAPALRGVHLGTKTGRSPGRRLGYSQIANPLYLARQGTMARGRAWRQIARNVAANLARLPRPEPWIDRVGRLSGNALAALDLARGRLTPERAGDLS